MTNAMPGGMGGLEGSVVQSMLQNPEVLRSMLQANPAIREVTSLGLQSLPFVTIGIYYKMLFQLLSQVCRHKTCSL